MSYTPRTTRSSMLAAAIMAIGGIAPIPHKDKRSEPTLDQKRKITKADKKRTKRANQKLRLAQREVN